LFKLFVGYLQASVYYTKGKLLIFKKGAQVPPERAMYLGALPCLAVWKKKLEWKMNLPACMSGLIVKHANC